MDMDNKNKIYIFDGVKSSITLDQYPPESWTWLSGKPDEARADFYAKVAAVFAAINLVAEATASMPFALVDTRTGEDYDTSGKWENKVGFMPYPRDLFRLIRQSITMTNTAYLFMETDGRRKKNLRYIVPSSVTPNWSGGTAQMGYTDAGLKSFTRRAGNGTRDYPVPGPIVYIWNRDYSTELMPSENTEYRAMENAAGLLYSVDFWVRNYFEKGGVKPTLVAIKGQISEQTKKDVETAWTKFVTGINKLRAKIINTEALDVKPFGDGIGDLKNTQVYRSALENICIALHMPISMLLSNAANFATAQNDSRMFFQYKIIPSCNMIADGLNEQVFLPLGLRLDFRPEQTDAGTEDEVQRAGAYAQYVGAGMKPSVAAQVVGIELPPGMEYDELNPQQPSEPPQAAPAQKAEPEPQIITAKFTPSIEHIREMKVWQDIAFRKHKRGDGLAFDFELRSLPEWVGAEIRARLAHAADIDDIRAAFDVEKLGETTTDAPEYKSAPIIQPQPRPEIITLAASITALAEAMKAAPSYAPPQAVRDAARRGLELREKHGRGGLTTQEAGQQGIGSGVARATNLANGDNVSLETIRRMRAFFARHEKNKAGGEDDAGYIAWQLWGGDAGRDWVDRVLREVDKPETKAAPIMPEPQPIQITVNNYPAAAPVVTVEAPAPSVIPAPVVTVTVPEQPAPIVNVTTPEQPAPSVTVNVPEQAAPIVNITNDVQPAPVVMPGPQTVRVKRDNLGAITGLESV
jgi:hypothetical protein